MQDRPPHKITEDVDALPPEERKHFVPIPEAEAVDLKAMTPKERATWLRNRRQRTLDELHVSGVAQAVYDRESKYLEKVRSVVKESKREKESLSKLLGYIIGTRLFLREFLIEEAAIIKVLEDRCGVSEADYLRLVSRYMDMRPTPRLYEVVNRLINEVVEWAGEEPASTDEDAGGLVAPEPGHEPHEAPLRGFHTTPNVPHD